MTLFYFKPHKGSKHRNGPHLGRAPEAPPPPAPEGDEASPLRLCADNGPFTPKTGREEVGSKQKHRQSKLQSHPKKQKVRPPHALSRPAPRCRRPQLHSGRHLASYALPRTPAPSPAKWGGRKEISGVGSRGAFPPHSTVMNHVQSPENTALWSLGLSVPRNGAGGAEGSSPAEFLEPQAARPVCRASGWRGGHAPTTWARGVRLLLPWTHVSLPGHQKPIKNV